MKVSDTGGQLNSLPLRNCLRNYAQNLFWLYVCLDKIILVSHLFGGGGHVYDHPQLDIAVVLFLLLIPPFVLVTMHVLLCSI